MVVTAVACFISFHEDGFVIGVCVVWSIKRRHHSLLHVVSSIGGIRHQREEPTQSVNQEEHISSYVKEETTTFHQ